MKIIKGFVISLGILFLLVIVAGACSGGDTTTEQPVKDKPAVEQPAKDEPKPLVGIGEELKVGDVVFKVTGTNTTKNVGGEYGVNAQGTFIVLDIEVRNEGAEAITMDSSFFSMTADGKTFESDSSAGIYGNENTDFFLTSINPDLSLVGKVYFDVSDNILNAPEQVLNVQTGFWGTETGEIKIK